MLESQRESSPFGQSRARLRRISFAAVEGLESRTLYSAFAGGSFEGVQSTAISIDDGLTRQPLLVSTTAAPTRSQAITLSASPTIKSVTLSFPTLTDLSIHTFTPYDNIGTVTEVGPVSTATLTNLNAGWGYTCIVSGTQNGASVSGSVTFTTLGHSPNGTLPTIGQLAPPSTPAPTAPLPAAISVTAVPTNASVALSFPALTDISIHTFTPADDCGTVTESDSTDSAMLTNLNAGWGYTCTVSGMENGASVSGSVTFTTLGHSPDGTVATIAQLAPPATAPTPTVPTSTAPTSAPPTSPVVPVTSTASGTLLDGTALPGPTNTGPTDPSLLAPSGSIIVTTPGAVIQNLSVTGNIRVDAPNVTIKNCVVNGNDLLDSQFCIQIDAVGTNCLVEDTTVESTGPSGHAILSAANNNTFLRINMHDTGSTGFYLSGSGAIENCYLYDIGWNALGIASNPLRANFGGNGHTEDVFLENGASFTIKDNYFDTPTYHVDNGVTYGLSAGLIFIDPYDAGDVVGPVNISDNYMDGGGFMFFLMGQGDVQITNNILGPDETYQGAWIYANYIGGPWSWSGNVDLNGNLIDIPTGLPVAGTS